MASLVLFFAGLVAAIAAKDPGDSAVDPGTGTAGTFFGTTNLYTIHLVIPLDQWTVMNESGETALDGGTGVGPGWNGPRMEVEFKEGRADLEFQGRPFGAIAVRFKGNSSYRFARNSLKRSLKLDFNDIEKGRTFFGLTKLNLNNNAMDPSQIREALAYEIFRAGGVPASRTAFARVFITVPSRYQRAYAGLYTIVEQVDERLLKDRFGSGKGMLLKPENLPGLPYLGDAWAVYTNRVHPKSFVTPADAARFLAFVKCLNQADDAGFQAAIRGQIDIEEFLRFLALEALLSNMDSPLMTGHNYYLYLEPRERRFVWVPWDLNEAFGGFNRAGSLSEQMNLSLDQPFTSVNRLAGRLMQMPGVKNRYHEIVRGLLATNFNATRLFPLIDTMAATIRSSLQNDPAVSMPQFEAALSEARQLPDSEDDNARRAGFRWNGPDGPGGTRRPRSPLKTFITERVKSAQLQLEGKAFGYVPKELAPGGGAPRRPSPPRGAR